MQNSADQALARCFVKVFGFTDTERHALNTVFRLSEGRPQAYSPWKPEAPHGAEIALIDGDSWEAALELANPANDSMKLIWVGLSAPRTASLVFSRPLQWAAIIEGMDRVLTPLVYGAPGQAASAEMPEPQKSMGSIEPTGSEDDYQDTVAADLDMLLGQFASSAAVVHADAAQTAQMTAAPIARRAAVAPVAEPEPEPDTAEVTAPAPLDADDSEFAAAQPRVLVVDADRDTRNYWRARLSLAGSTGMDEASTGLEALELVKTQRYGLVVVDMDLHDIKAWSLVEQLRRAEFAPAGLILTGPRMSWLDGVRGRWSGVRACLQKPFHPKRLTELLSPGQ